MVCRIKKVLYGLKQEPRTWYARLDKYLANLGFSKGTTDITLYLMEIEDGFLIVIVFVDDIIIRGNEDSKKFSKNMKNEFEMSMIGEMNYLIRIANCSKQRRYLYFLDQVFEIFSENTWFRKL